jgi:hypothetical protein
MAPAALPASSAHFSLTGFLGSISIWTGLVVGALTVIDWLLRESQKVAFQGAVAAAWVWLDDQRAEKFFAPFESYRVQVGFAVAVHMLIFCFFQLPVFYLLLPGQSLFQSAGWGIGILLSAALYSWKVIPLAIRWIVKDRSLLSINLRTYAVSLLSCLPFLLTSLVLHRDHLFLMYKAVRPGLQSTPLSFPAELILGLFFPLATVFSFLYMAFGMFILMVWCLAAILWPVKFVLIRIAENPKGPVFGLCGLFIAIGAIVKAVTQSP